MKVFSSVKDVSNLQEMVDSALELKQSPFAFQYLGTNKTIGLIFLNPSLRTRLSTQKAALNLGMTPIFMNMDKEGWGLEIKDIAMNGTTVEHIREAAAVMGQYCDILAIRAFPKLEDRDEDYSEELFNKFVKYCGIPVVSLESATRHPLQSFADLITIEELKKTEKPKVVLTWAPHIKSIPQCVANSFSEWVNAWGEADFVITHPAGYELDEKFTKGATITQDQNEALAGADFVYVKNWSAYHDYGKVLSTDDSWMLTNKKLATSNHAKVMHCLPVRRNVELSSEVLDSANSIVTQQASNRVWAAQAVLSEILNALK